MTIKIVSFGYHHRRPPHEANAISDCRGLPNPFRNLALRAKTGKDPEVREYVRGGTGASDSYTAFVYAAAKVIAAEGRGTYAFGCYGGRHRSVVVADDVADLLRQAHGLDVEVEHLDLDRIKV